MRTTPDARRGNLSCSGVPAAQALSHRPRRQPRSLVDRPARDCSATTRAAKSAVSSAATISPSRPATTGTAASSATRATARGRLCPCPSLAAQAIRPPGKAAGPPRATSAPALLRSSVWMRDHELVAYRDKDDPGDDREVQIGVDVAAIWPRSSAVAMRSAPGPCRRPGRSTATTAPSTRGRRAGARRRRHAQPRVRGGGARQHDALPERDDHEELEALAEMGSLDLPLAHGRTSSAR